MERKNLRKVFVNELIKLAQSDDTIVALDSDSKEPTFMDLFEKEFPNRSFSFGIAEQDMVCAAGGMATMGLKPVVNSYALFIAMRALDQVRNSVAYPNLNVVFNLSHHGLDIGADGITHQLTEDMAIFRSIPNLKLLFPLDEIEMIQMVNYAFCSEGPVIIKSGKSSVLDYHSDSYQWEYGVPSLIMEGKKVAVISNGVLIEKAVKAREILQREDDMLIKIINLSTLTNIDHDKLLLLLQDIDFIVTLEDHSIYGGLGSAITEIICEHRPLPVIRLGLKDQFAQCGDANMLFKHYKMDESAVIDVVRERMK